MILYRLVDIKHDPTTVGDYITRCSDKSNQKLGRGIYFALSEEDARAFAATRNYEYTHLLTVEISYDQNLFFDLRSKPNAITKWLRDELAANRLTHTEFNQMRVNDKNMRFCDTHGMKGLIWSPGGSLKWDELVLLEPFVNEGARIIASTPLTSPV